MRTSHKVLWVCNFFIAFFGFCAGVTDDTGAWVCVITMLAIAQITAMFIAAERNVAKKRKLIYGN